MADFLTGVFRMKSMFEIGFLPVGRWLMVDNNLKLELDIMIERRNVLYAFASEDAVLYVGKTTQTLRRRMLGYFKPNNSQRTNQRNHLAIIDLLNQEKPVEILALADSGLHRYGAFHLNLAAGLEDSIIEIMRPAWNGGRTSSEVETQEESNPSDGSVEAKMESEYETAAQSFSLILQPAYYDHGFFNAPTEFSDLFAGDQAGIEIYCGEEKLLVLGKISRRARSNLAPRIMGGVPLRSWFQKKELKQLLHVSILSSTSISIS